MMLDKKANSSGFLNEFKMGGKAAETTHINNHLAQKLLMNVQCSGGSRSFTRELTASKMRNAVAGHWKLMSAN